MRVLISGASGFVGQALTASLTGSGHAVVRLVRSERQAATGDGECFWAPGVNALDPGVLDGIDVVINLNGRSIAGGRWSDGVKKELRSSRLRSTETIVDAVRKAVRPPKLVLSASAIGFYGDRGEDSLDEWSSAGSGFLADLSRDWEEAAAKAGSDSTRVVMLRLGMVVGKGGAVGKMLLPFRLGVGGPIGSGKQWWSWIALDDVVGAIEFLMTQDDVEGPVNLVSPEASRCRDFSMALGKALNRPAFMPMPAFAARLVLGEMADSLLLASTRVQPAVLERLGYQYAAGDLERALRRAV